MRKIEIQVQNNGAVLTGTLFQPADKIPAPTIVVAHGAQMGLQDHWLYQHLIDTASSLGASVLVTDRRGSGSSDGNIEEASFDELAEDLLSFIDHLKKKSYSAPGRRISRV